MGCLFPSDTEPAANIVLGALNAALGTDLAAPGTGAVDLGVDAAGTLGALGAAVGAEVAGILRALGAAAGSLEL